MEYMARCKFCGQNIIINGGDNMTDEEINNAAIFECKCDEAALYTARYNHGIYAKDNINELFKDDGQAVTDLLKAAVDKITDGVIKTAKVETVNGVKAEVLLKANSIKVVRTTTNKKALET